MTFRIFGHGTLSGDFLPHPNYAEPPSPPEEHYKYHPINIYPASNVFVEGLTIANSPSHSLSLVGIFSKYLIESKKSVGYIFSYASSSTLYAADSLGHQVTGQSFEKA